MTYLDYTGLQRFWEQVKNRLDNKVDKVSGKSLIADSEIARLASINEEDYVTEEELATKLEEGVLTVNGQKGNVSITAESIGAITNINGVTPNEDGTFELNASNVGGLTVDLDGALEGQGPKINADLLAGKEASDYALIANIVTSVNGQIGDVVITEGGGQIDTTGFYSISNPPPYPVTSVNGKTGAIEITAASLGAITNVPVTSVNTKTGAVKLTADDVGALPNTYKPPVTSVNGQTGDVNISFSAPVTSVNGKTGAVTIPEIKYADLTFDFSGMELASYATLPSGLSNVNQIINILSFTNQVFITKPWIYNGKLYVAAHSTDIDGEGNTLYPYYLKYYDTTFTARVFYF